MKFESLFDLANFILHLMVRFPKALAPDDSNAWNLSQVFDLAKKKLHLTSGKVGSWTSTVHLRFNL
jgi:hypothetical protein